MGTGIHATEAMADDLVAAQDDDLITEYRREAHPVGPGVDLTLVPLDFDEVVAVADRYRDVDGVELVQISSGPFGLIRDEGNDDLRITYARERLVHRANRRFHLTGGFISGRGPLDLFVVPAERDALQAFVDANADDRTLHRVRVHAGKPRRRF